MQFLTFENLNFFAKKWKTLDAFAIFFARYLPYLLFCFLIAFSFYYDFINIFLGALVAGCIGRLINEFVHIFYKIKRTAYLTGTKVLVPFAKNYSFPSGHASFFFGISFYLFFYFKLLGTIFLLLSFLIGIARVFCGVHWTKDIFGGVFTGLISAFVINYFLINLWI